MPIQDPELDAIFNPKGKAQPVARSTVSPMEAVKRTSRAAAQAEEDISPGGYVFGKALESAFGFFGRAAEAARAAPLDNSPLMSIARMVLPRDYVNSISIGRHVPMVSDDGGPATNALAVATDPNNPTSPENTGAVLSPTSRKFFDPIQNRVVFEETPAPGPVSKIAGVGASFAGDPLNLLFPVNAASIPGKIVKSLVQSFTAGVGSELGGMAGGATGEAIAGEQGAKAGRMIGSLGGAVAGNYSASLRSNALKEVAGGVGDYGKAAAAAIARRKESGKSLSEIFNDELADLRGTTTGYIQQSVNEKVAKALALDPHAVEEAKRFEDAARRQGVDPGQFTIGQRTASPQMIAAERGLYEETRDPALVGKIIGKSDAQKDAVVGAWKRAKGEAIAPDAKHLSKQLEEARAVAQERLKGLDNDRTALLNKNLKVITPEERFAIGEDMQARAQGRADMVTGRVREDYTKALEADAQAGIPYNISNLETTANNILGPNTKITRAKLEPSQTPASIVRLQQIILKKKAAAVGGDEIIGNAATKAIKEDEFPKATLTELNDLKQQINADLQMQSVKQGPAYRHLTMLNQAVDDVINKQALPDVKELYDTAKRNYATNVVPVKKEGTNRAMLRKIMGGTRANEDYITPGNAMMAYLKAPGSDLETKMRQFDNLFGGYQTENRIAGTSREAQVYNNMGRMIENEYRDKVLSSTDIFDIKKHDEFMREWAPAIKRVDWLGPKLDRVGYSLENIQNQMKSEAERWKRIIKDGKIAESVGYAESKDVIKYLLEDPRHVSRFLREFDPAMRTDVKKALINEIFSHAKIIDGYGNYRPDEMLKLLTAGRAYTAETGSASSLERIFTATFGKAEGKKHLQNLEDIALMAKQQRLNDPRYLKSGEAFSADPLQENIGSSGATLATQIKNAGSGYGSPLFHGTIALTRFANARMRQAYEQAMFDAFSNPKDAEMILELSKKEAGMALSQESATRLAGKMGEAGKEFLKKLADAGYIMHGNVTKGVVLEMSHDKQIEDRKAQERK